MHTESYAVQERPNSWGPIGSGYPKFESPTSVCFKLDSYWAVQLFSFFSPNISGALSWDVPEEAVEERAARYKRIIGMSREIANAKAPTAIGAIFFDSNTFFGNSCSKAWNTHLPQFWLTARGIRKLNYNFLAAGDTETMPAPKLALPLIEIHTPQLPMAQAIELETPHSALLQDLRQNSPWSSWRALEAVLGASHTQLQRIAGGVLPSAAIAKNIDELHRFSQRLNKVTRANPTATLRVLSTPRDRDGWSANDFLARQDYRNAFRAVMDAASLKPTIAAAEPRPLRWYNEASRDLYEDGAEPEQ